MGWLQWRPRPPWSSVSPAVFLHAAQVFVSAAWYDVNEYRGNKNSDKYGLNCGGKAPHIPQTHICPASRSPRLLTSGQDRWGIGLCMFLLEPVSGGQPSIL